MSENPYNWRARRPGHAIPHPLRDELVRELRRGELFTLIGGHGMGKTVLLTQVADALIDASTNVVFIERKPVGDCTESACIEQLARRIELEPAPGELLLDVLRRWFAANPGRSLILLYDEIDQYIDGGAAGIRDFLNAMVVANSEFPERLGVIVAGGLSVYRLRSASQLASNYVGKAVKCLLEPFTEEHLVQLAFPFQEAARPLARAAMELLRLLSGGRPGLVAFALEQLWKHEGDLDVMAVREAFEQFIVRNHEEYVIAVHRGLGVGGPEGNWATALWNHLDQHPGEHTRKALFDCVRHAGADGQALDDTVQLLQASGLIRVRGKPRANPLIAESIPSIVRLPMETEEDDERGIAHDPNAQLRHDLQRVLGRIGLWGMDFFTEKKAENGTKEYGIVDERVVSAVLGIGLLEAGWQHGAREAQRGPGFTDLALYHPRFPDRPPAVIEVKIWPRNDYYAVHEQVAGYCQDGPAAEQCAAVVMLGTRQSSEAWKTDYVARCLGDCDHTPHPVDPPLTAAYIATRKAGLGAGIPVIHFLLGLHRRR